MAVEVVVAVAAKIAEYLVAPIVTPIARPFGYLLYYHKNIEDLRIQVRSLEDVKNGVQRSVEVATRRGEVIRSEVKNWVDSVTVITAEAHTLLQNDAIVSRRCWSRYRLSKQAKTKLKVATQLKKDGGFDHVSNPPPPPSIESMSTGDYFAFQSTRMAFDEVMNSLQDDSVNMIGVYGVGGLGKTTLVKEIGKHVKVEKHFDEVLMAVVSQTPNIKSIQDILSEMLGLNLTETNSETTRAIRLLDTLNGLLKEKKILVILDDIWSELELADIGIPSTGNNNNLKIVLTTRREQVCRVMGCQRNVALDVLSELDSWNLFREKTGDVADSTTLNVVAREVATECCGLPIALVTVGRALRNNRDLQQWKQAVVGLRSASPTYIEGVDEKVYASLKLSYDYLPGEESMEMFLLCCLFPEDRNIEIEALVLYVVGKRLFQGLIANTVDEIRSRAYEVIQNIKDSCLLLKSDEEYCIKVHDVVRDVGISIASANNISIAKASTGLKEWPTRMMTEHCTSISLMYNDIRELPHGLNCPRLKILLLQGNGNLREIPDAFFEGMISLEVLDLSYTRVSAFPASIKLLRNLRTLRAKDMELDDISILGQLKNLEILDLEYLKTFQLRPIEIGHLSNLRVLNLNDCSQFSDSMCSFISSLSQLEELYLPTYDLLDEVKNIKWKSLSRLSILHTIIEDVEVLPKELCARLKKFHIATAGSWDTYIAAVMLNMKARRMSLCPSWSSIFGNLDAALTFLGEVRFGDAIKMLLERTRVLRFYSRQFWRNFILDLDELRGGLQCLQYLSVGGCDGIEYVIRAREVVDYFPNLESLAIYYLKDLKEICHCLLPQTRCFWKLSVLFVGRCDNLRTVVPFNLMTKLLNLENLHVEECKQVEAVFDSNHEGISFPQEDVRLLSTLTDLRLESMNELQKIWKGPTQLVCLHNLKCIFVHSCGKLREIFSPTLSQTLLQLEDLTIWICAELEEVVIGHEEEITVVDDIIFPKLNSIQLLDLRNLKCFCSWRISFQFPSLETLIVQNCDKMKTFTSELISTPNLKLLQLNSEDYSQAQWLEDLNHTIPHLYNTNQAGRRGSSSAST